MNEYIDPENTQADDDTQQAPRIEFVVMVRPYSHADGFQIWADVMKPSQRYNTLKAEGFKEFTAVQE